jgi:hypothetical protein
MWTEAMDGSEKSTDQNATTTSHTLNDARSSGHSDEKKEGPYTVVSGLETEAEAPRCSGAASVSIGALTLLPTENDVAVVYCKQSSGMPD